MESEIKKQLYEIMDKDPEARYQLQYRDYHDDRWTLPVLLKDYRIDVFVDDLSLKRIKIRYSDGTIKTIIP